MNEPREQQPGTSDGSIGDGDAGLAQAARDADRLAFGPQLPERLDLRACLAATVLGVLTGAVAVLYRQALDGAIRLHDGARANLAMHGVAGWLGLLALTAAVGALARLLVERFSPESAGSGIPSVEARLQDGSRLRWPRILPVKFAGGLLALATGMSLGREGPTVQIGAALGEAVSGRGARDARTRAALVAAGAGAGLAGAFGAPIAGLLFVLEELRFALVPLTYATALLACLACQLVVRTFLGSAPILGAIDPAPLGGVGLALAAGCGVVCGLVGVLYNAAILAALDLADALSAVPGWVRAALGACCAIPVAAFVPDALFGNENVVGRLLHDTTAPGPDAITALAFLAAAKIAFTATSYATGVVGGLFAPQLVIGAALGAMLGKLAAPLLPGVPLATILAAAGAAAIFTASVRVPLTGIVLLLEMTGANRQIFALAIAAAAAYLVATALRSLPIYEALGARAVRSVGATERRRRAQSA